MIPPTSIDGTDITGATIDGQDVQEITVDGQTVFAAGPDIPDSGVYLFVEERYDGIDAYETQDPGFFTSSDGPNYTTSYGGDEKSSAIALNNLGDKVYYSESKNTIRQESLSTPFDLRTNQGVESSLTVNVSTSSENPYGFGLVFFDSGNKMYVSTGELTGDGEQRLYELSTQYDIDTASYIRSDFVPDNTQGASVLEFNPDGSKCYNSERGGTTIAQHDLSTPFDVSTKTNRQAVSRGEDNVGFKWGPNGIYAYIVQHSPHQVSRMEASTAYDVTSLSSATQIAGTTGGTSYNGVFVSGPPYY